MGDIRDINLVEESFVGKVKVAKFSWPFFSHAPGPKVRVGCLLPEALRV